MRNITKYGQKNLRSVSTNGLDKVLYSYTTPVAIVQNGEYFVTEQKFSVTTSKHINFFLKREKAPTSIKISQESIQEKAKQLLGANQLFV